MLLDLGRFPHVALCHQPTPLEQMPRLTERLGGPNLWIKRDDCTGLATGSTGTQAGMVAGLCAIDAGIPVMGISVRQEKGRQTKAVHALAEKTAAKFDSVKVPLSKVLVDDGYVGEGYGVPAESTLEAIVLAARLEGVLLDPVYSGKGLAGLIGLVWAGFFDANDNVVFLHTGGVAGLFAYQAAFSRQTEEAGLDLSSIAS